MKRGDGYAGECLRPLGCNCPPRQICDYYHSAGFTAVFEDRKVDFVEKQPPVNGADALGWKNKPGDAGPVVNEAREHVPSKDCWCQPKTVEDFRERPAFGPEDEDILAVLQATNEARTAQYGAPEDNFARIARHWQVYLLNAKGLDVDVTPTDVALLMDLMKTARLENMPSHRDSWVDKAGYARCGAAIEANLARYGRKAA